MWPRFVNAGLAVWLMAAPAVLGYEGTGAEISERIVGPVLFTSAVVAMWQATRLTRWGSVACGVWLLVSPWIFGFGGAALANELLVGALALAMGLVRGRVAERFGGGWGALWPPHRPRSGSGGDPGTA